MTMEPNGEKRECLNWKTKKHREFLCLFSYFVKTQREFRVVAKRGRVMLNANGEYAMLVTISFVYKRYLILTRSFSASSFERYWVGNVIGFMVAS